MTDFDLTIYDLYSYSMYTVITNIPSLNYGFLINLETFEILLYSKV